MEHAKAIARYSSNVIFKIILFITVYIALIAVGVVLLWLSVFLVTWGFPNVIIEIRNIRVIFVIAIFMLGVLGFALMFGLYLFKFLFSKTKNENRNRKQITKEQCPQLFEAISEVAKATSCPMPKKVFLSPDVNACVFYNTSFWSIFFPVKKNLEIGLGMFNTLNVDELKAILAHEFGHFSQKSMKVGSGVYVANTVIHDLAFQEDKWDRWVDEWCAIDYRLVSMFGSLTRGFTNVIRKILRGMYGIVNRSYMKLSRQMEYDADTIACMYTGKDVFISGLCKIEFTARAFQYSGMVAENIISDHKRPESIFRIHEIITGMRAARRGITVSAGVLVNEPLENNKSYSNIFLENTWDTHPSLESRIANVKELKESKDIDFRPAWVLVPENIVSEISDMLLTDNAEDLNGLDKATDLELTEYCSDFNKAVTISAPYKTFIDRDIIPFSQEDMSRVEVAYPFTKENEQLIMKYQAALEDADTLYDILNKQIEAEKIVYKGVEYSPKKLPIDEHTEYMESLREPVAKIDVNVYQYIINRVDDDKREEVQRHYDALFLIQKIFDQYSYDISIQVNAIINIFSVAVTRSDAEWIEIKRYVFSAANDIKEMINKTNWELMETALDSETTIQVKEFGQQPGYHSLKADIDIDAINTFINMQEEYFKLLRIAYAKTKVKLGALMEETEQKPS